MEFYQSEKMGTLFTVKPLLYDQRKTKKEVNCALSSIQSYSLSEIALAFAFTQCEWTFNHSQLCVLTGASRSDAATVGRHRL